MNDPAPLLGAKLLPPTPGPFHLGRPRLHQQLQKSLEGRATVILAGPGYGKTCLVSRFLQETAADSVWLSLDASDRDPWMLFRYLIQGLREHSPEFGSRTEGVWHDLRSRADAVEPLCDLLVGDAEESLGGRVVVVLDETQHLDPSPLCTRALKRLLAYLPGTLHLILIGRSVPDLGIRALAAEGAACIIPGEDLLFTLDETRTLLLETFSLPMRGAAVERVHARTRGWVTALQLLRQTARLEKESPDLAEEVFVRTESEIFDYFSEEVLAAESPTVREFLLASSIPVVLDPELCAEALPGLDAREILATLLRRKLFVSPLESRGELYAYDPLFRDFLRRKLRSEKGAAGTRDLERRYGHAFARRGEFSQALTHLLAAEDHKGIAEVLRRNGKVLLRAGMLDPIREAARFLSARGVRSAALEDLLGETARLAGDHVAAIGHFESALAGGSRGSAGLSRAFRTSVLQGLAYSLLKTGKTSRAAATAEEALSLSSDGDPAQRARILNGLSIIRYRENRHAEALVGWQEALALARHAQDEHLTLMIAHNLGLPHAVLGDFRRAAECFRILTQPDNTRLGPEEGAAFLNLARIETLRGEYARAARLLGDALEIATRLRLKALTADILEAEGTLLRETGDLQGAAERYARTRDLFTELGLHDLLDGLAEEEAILAARRGEPDEAERLAAGVVDRRRKADDAEGIASSLLALGEVRVQAGRFAAALDPLSESAGIFRSLERAYQECRAHLFLAFACFLANRRDRAQAAAQDALRLAERYDYRATVRQVADRDRSVRKWLASIPGAPSYLKEDAGGDTPPEMRAGPARLRIGTGGHDLTVRLLGPFEVFRDAENRIPARAWKIRRALEIFCVVASSRDHRATKDRIVDALWGEARPSVIEKNFHPTISFLRNALNFAHTVPKNFILFEGGAYLLNPAYRYEIDVERFEAGIREARASAAQGAGTAALAAFDAALELYRGPFMEEAYEEWTEAPRAHYERLYVAALEEAGRLHTKCGEAGSELPLFRKRVEHDPLNEAASSDLMMALGRTGNRAGVETEYARLVQALAEEMDDKPLPETRQAYETARAMEPPRGAKLGPRVPLHKPRRTLR